MRWSPLWRCQEEQYRARQFIHFFLRFTITKDPTVPNPLTSSKMSSTASNTISIFTYCIAVDPCCFVPIFCHHQICPSCSILGRPTFCTPDALLFFYRLIVTGRSPISVWPFSVSFDQVVKEIFMNITCPMYTTSKMLLRAVAILSIEYWTYSKIDFAPLQFSIQATSLSP